ncbi:MAG: RNA chaperone Hfq [Alphaproteobacteria bacterium]|jgi:host factor-I protein|nr:RNA chaperone Hfq [Alphaproteobacteria bacterium]MCV6599050.1 RNA chaperone Hfq [Alphaproteobacteria bacterium]
MADIQTNFLNKIKKEEQAVTIFLVNGVKLNGTIISFDNSTIVLQKDNNTQLVYKQAISTVMPAKAN